MAEQHTDPELQGDDLDEGKGITAFPSAREEFADEESIEDYEHYFEDEVEESEEEESETEEIAFQEEGFITWRKIVLLSFNEAWMTLILCSTIMYLCIITYMFSFSTQLTSRGMFVPIFLDLLYVADIAFVLIYKSWSQLNTVTIHLVRKDWKLTLDLISAVPFDSVFFLNHGVMSNRSYELNLFRLNRLLRIVRIREYFDLVHNTVSHIKVSLYVMEWLTHYIIQIQIFGTLLFMNKCFHMEECWPVNFVRKNLTNFEWYLVSVFSIMGQTTNRAYPDVQIKRMNDDLIMLITSVVAFFGIMGYILGYLTAALVHKKRDIFFYARNLKTAHLYLKTHRVTPKLGNRVIYFCEEFWKRRYGVKEFNLYRLLPTVTVKLVAIDIFWHAFKHSHIFRNMDMAFLQTVAVHMTYEFCLPGDIIFERNKLKHKMIYIVSGVIEILSEQDEETPILSLSAGTCLGESTLFFSYYSNTTVRCTTSCEIMVLDQTHLLIVLNDYPFHSKFFLRLIRERYRRSIELKQLTTLNLMDDKIKGEHITSLLWLKNTMQKLMLDDKSTKHIDQPLMHEDKSKKKTEQLEGISQTEYSPNNLDLYVMTEELELVTDPVCLQSSWPWIFQPTSQVLIAWDVIVLIVILLTATLLPYYALFSCPPLRFKDVNSMTTMCPDAENAVVIRVLAVVIFTLDIVIQALTAVRKKEELLANWKLIIAHRITKLGFIADIISSLPLELFVYIMEDVEHPAVVMNTLSLNRLLKLYKMEVMFAKVENEMHVHIKLLLLLKYGTYLCFAVYYSAAILYAANCYRGYCTFDTWVKFYMAQIVDAELISITKYNPELISKTHIMIAMLISTAMWCGKSMSHYYFVNYVDLLICITIVSVSSFIFLYLTAGLSATQILQAKHRVQFVDMIRTIRKTLREYNIDMNMQQYVMVVLKTKWNYLNNFNTLYISKILYYASEHLREEVQINICLKTLLNVPFFQEVNSAFVKKAASMAEILVTPPNMPVMYTGEVVKEMYIIINGYCEVLSNLTGKRQKILGPNDHFGAVEIFLHIPSATTVCTITSCRIAAIKESDITRVLAMFPSIQMDLKEVVATFSDMQQLAKFRSIQFTFDTLLLTTSFKTSSFISYGISSTRKGRRKIDFEEPFMELGLLGLIRYLLMPVAIMPDGKFIIWWEAFRIVFAFLTCLWYPARIIVMAQSQLYTSIIDKVLDIPAFIDLYVRCHVCYYNDNGILVTHPLKTLLYYIKHGFLLDLLGCLPVELLQLTQRNRMYSYFTLLRVVQSHRILAMFYYLQNDIISKHRYILVMKYFPIAIVIVNFAASCICTLQCRFHEDIKQDPAGIYTEGVVCSNDSWMHRSVFANPHIRGPLTPAYVYIYGLYWMTTTITGCALRGIVCHNDSECAISIFLNIAGMIGYLHVISSIIASRASRNVDLTIYQEKMHSLVNYMNSAKIPTDLCRDVIKYFEYMWIKKQGNDVLEMLQIFHFTLREDILVSIFGRTLKEVAVLTNAGTSFYRVLLENMKVKFFMKHGTLINLNDCEENIYFIHKGRVDVLSPDGTKLQTLHKGGMIGNFESIYFSRQTLIVEARSHVEVLMMKTQVLYGILNKYPHLKEQFFRITQLQRDFVLPVTQRNIEMDEEDNPSLNSSVQSLRSSRLSFSSLVTGLKNKVFSREKMLYKIWELCILVVGAFMNYSLILYQAALMEYSIPVVVIQYVFDITYIVKIYLKFHLAYEDESGDLIVDFKSIRKRYMHEYFGLYLDIFTILPLELFSFAFGSYGTDSFVIAFGFFRFNRLPRILFLMEFFQISTNKLNINVFLRRFFYIILTVVLLMHTTTCCMIMMKTLYILNWKPLQMSVMDRIKAYVDMLRVSINIFVGNPFHKTYSIYPWLALYNAIACIVGQLVQAYIVGEMCAVLEIVGYTKIHYANKIANMKSYLKLQGLSVTLLRQVWDYVIYLWDTHRGTQVPILLMEAPDYLIEGVKASLYGHHISTNYVFCTCQRDFLRQLVTKLKQYTFFPGNYIAYQGEVNDSMYFVYSGEVEVVSNSGDYYFPDLQDLLMEGDVFGMVQGLYPVRMHKYSYRAKTRTIVLILLRTDWEYLLKYFPEAKQEIYERATSLHFTI